MNFTENLRNKLKKTVLRLLRPVALRYFPIAYARSMGVNISSGCRWISPDAATFGSEPYLVHIDDHVSIGGRVRFITHDGGVWVFRKELPDLDVVDRIRIGNNVFIGNDTVILPGVQIHDNVVIGTRAVVTRDIPSHSVAVGVPARVVSTLEDYKKRCLEKGLNTKGISPQRKAEFLSRSVPCLNRAPPCNERLSQ
jgi:acetyltransferase-like isoleucine patch superfamily enzyme